MNQFTYQLFDPTAAPQQQQQPRYWECDCQTIFRLFETNSHSTKLANCHAPKSRRPESGQWDIWKESRDQL